MPKNHDTSADELSRLLDELNTGKAPLCDDPELRELLGIATLLHNHPPAVPQPPQHVLELTVAQAQAGLRASKRRRFTWLFSGAIGTAAAVLLAFGLHFYSAPPALQPPIVADTGETVLPTVVPPATAALPARQSPSSSPSPVASQHSAIRPPTAAKDNALPGKPIINGEQSDSSRLAAASPPGQNIVAEHAPTLFKSTRLPDTFLLMPAKLPGRTPAEISQAADGSTVRQVFDPGTTMEVIITQRWSSTVGKTANTTSSNADTNHRLSITRNGQDITLEGRLPLQELQRLADTLQL